MRPATSKSITLQMGSKHILHLRCVIMCFGKLLTQAYKAPPGPSARKKANRNLQQDLLLLACRLSLGHRSTLQTHERDCYVTL